MSTTTPTPGEEPISGEYEYLYEMLDDLEVHVLHGKGCPCGEALFERLVSEVKDAPADQLQDFVGWLTDNSISDADADGEPNYWTMRLIAALTSNH